jgi:hypothetical protein
MNKGVNAMKKFVAKSVLGKEYLYSQKCAFIVPNKNAKRIMDTLNANHVALEKGEIWHIYDCNWYDEPYICYKINIRGGKLRVSQNNTKVFN